jgi:hypothetical protein
VALAESAAIPAVIAPVLQRAITTVDHYFVSLMRVIFARARPIEALEQVESYSLEQVTAYANDLLGD